VIPQRNISLLSNRLAKDGGRRVREDVLERDYCLAWFLAMLADSDLKKVLAFKGGTALKRCYFADYRFSEDLDFTLTEPISFDDLRSGLEPIYESVRTQSGITFGFDREDRHKHGNSYTFYLKYEGPLPTGNDVKVDVTLRERLVHPLENRPVLRGYEEFADVPENHALQVYSLNEIAAEKVVALADRARNEPRDLYDLWYLSSNGLIDLSLLAEAVRQKLEFRGKPEPGLMDGILRKEARLKVLWTGRLAYQMVTLPEFDETFRTLRRALREADFP
jgi:uncharacterized protein